MGEVGTVERDVVDNLFATRIFDSLLERKAETLTVYFFTSFFFKVTCL